MWGRIYDLHTSIRRIMSDDFNIDGQTPETDLTFTQAQAEVEELERELKRLQEEQAAKATVIDDDPIEIIEDIEEVPAKPKKAKTNAEAYASSEKNVADMLADYDAIANVEKPKKKAKAPAKKEPVKKAAAKKAPAKKAPAKKVMAKKPEKAEKPVKKSKIETAMDAAPKPEKPSPNSVVFRSSSVMPATAATSVAPPKPPKSAAKSPDLYDQKAYAKKNHKKPKKVKPTTKVAKWFKGLTPTDYMIAGTAALILIVAVVTLNMYTSARAEKLQLAEFATLGENLSDIGIAGEGTLYAMADNRGEDEIIDFEEEIEDDLGYTEYEEKEDEDSGNVTVALNMTTVVKDLKIKFINKKTGKLIAGVPFEVEIVDANGKTMSKVDEDKDGIIYINPMQFGTTKVTLKALRGYDTYSFNTDTQTIEVKEKLDYKKIDVADEVKSEKQVNAAVEDTAGKLAVESQLTDTVQWVESTRTATGTSSKYVQVSASDIAVPNAVSKVDWINKLYYRVKEFTQDTVIGKVRAEEGEPTPEPTEEPEPTKDPEPTTDPEPTKDPEPTPTDTVTPTPTSEAHEHVFKDDEEVPASCTDKGYKKTKCSCGETKKEEIPALGHDFVNGVCKRCKTKQGTTPTPTPTKKVNNTAKLLTKNGEQLYIKSGDNYKVAIASDYLDNPNQAFYKQSSEATGYKYTGWQDIDGSTYFFDADGNKVTGEQVIQGAKYNFGSDGALQKGSGNLGIDVSKWNGSIDWNKVKSSGISYVIIRCGYRGSTTGALIEDPTFRSNIKGATNAGLKVGIYFFSQATNEVEAVEEASMTLSLISGYKISYPVFLDVEDSGGRGDKIDSGTRTQVINAFCQTIRNSGYTPGVYANKTWLQSKFSPGSINAKIWLAQYAATPTYSGGYQMWQYSSKGSVSGIKGNVDMNLSYLGY